ncbi:MAG TPA: hypothetical protein VK186_23230 [Candidatus Deferrimicrobium sp.]|nr:hypothetical protein [Candidatus Deferrimicrobium sp.]
MTALEVLEYCDNDGAFWVKSGSDKRKVTSPEELQRLFQSSGKIYADEGLKYGKLNLAGLLLFGKNPSRFRPAFTYK